MDRILEPEIMDDRDADEAYARADFSDSNQAFADRLGRALARARAAAGALDAARTRDAAGARDLTRARHPTGAHDPARARDGAHTRGDATWRIVDLGCGPADVTIRIARAVPGSEVVAVDGSEEMLRLAREAVRAAGLSDRITLHLGRVPGLELPERGFDAVVSKDMLHHLPDPHLLWSEVSRLARPGAIVQVMDLIRPASLLEAREIVERVASREHPLLKEDFYHSLCAAFTIDEVRAQLRAAGLALTVEPAGDRHMVIEGVVGIGL